MAGSEAVKKHGAFGGHFGLRRSFFAGGSGSGVSSSWAASRTIRPGASRLATFRRVVLPQLRPTTFFLSITVLINSLQIFDIINVMTQGGPLGTGTTTMVYQVYLETFRNFRAGYGAAVASIMFVVLLAITYYQVRVMDRGQRK